VIDLKEVYERTLRITGREDLARLAVAIFLHERGPAGYEAGYGYTDSGPLAQWKGKQVEGVAHELKRFFGKDRPVNSLTIREFQREEWRASDPLWWSKVSAWWNKVRDVPLDSVKPIWEQAFSGKRPATPPLPRYVTELPPGPGTVRREPIPDNVRRYLLLGLGMVGLAVVWKEVR
jgi:hypothetical protein